MSALHTDLYEALRDGANTAALVSGRVYPGEMPQNVTLPAVLYFRVSGVRLYSHQGASGLDEARVQVECWAATYDGAQVLATAVRKDLEALGYRLTNQLDMPILPETRTRRVILDFKKGHYDD